MVEGSSTKVVQPADVKLTAPQLRLPDADSTAEVVLAQAVKFCAKKMGLNGHQAVIERLRQGDASACTYCHYSVAKQVAESIGSLDQNVKAVYMADYDATPQDLCFSHEMQTSPVHLIVWAERKTSALDSLIDALDRALVQRYIEVIGTRQLQNLLDVQVVNDKEVKNRIGYGAMLSSLHQKPIQLWER